MRVEVAVGSGCGDMDAAALDAVRRARYRPALSGGVPVAAAVDQPIRFRLRS